MDSKFIKLAFVIEDIKEKEEAYLNAKEEFDKVFAKAKKYGKLSEQLEEKDGFWNACKLMYYAKKYFVLIEKAEKLHKILEMKLKEWKFALEKI